MPVLIYALPEGLALPPEPPEHPALAERLEVGTQGEETYAAYALPPGFRPLPERLPPDAACAVWTQLKDALEELHGQGQTHGRVLRPQIWWDGETALLGGAGLPWDGQVSSDLAALAELVAELLGGVEHAPEPLRTELGAQLAPALPTRAPEALPLTVPPEPRMPETGAAEESAAPEAALEAPPPASLPAYEVVPDLPRDLPGQEAVRPSEPEMIVILPDPDPVASSNPAEPALPADRPEPQAAVPVPERVSVLERAETGPQEPAQTPVPELPALEDVDEGVTVIAAPKRRKSPQVQAPEPATPGHALGDGPRGDAGARVLRIGWEEDHTWRQVKAPPAPRRAGFSWRHWAALIGVVALLSGVAAWLALRPAPPAAVTQECCVVQFQLVKGGRPVAAQARLLVKSAPRDSFYRPGDLLGLIPGPIRFPATGGEYVLEVSLEGYQPQNFTLKLPEAQAQPVEIELP